MQFADYLVQIHHHLLQYGNYPVEMTVIVGMYPYIAHPTLNECRELSNLRANKNFLILDKFVFRYFEKQSLRFSDITHLLSKLNNPQQYKLYFFNVARFRRIYKYHALKYPIKDENMFFDNQFFDMWQSCLRIALKNPEFWGNEELVIEFHQGIFRLKAWIDRQRASNNQKTVDESCMNLKRLVSSKIQIEPKLFSEATKISTTLNPELTMFLLMLDIRKIHHNQDLYFLMYINSLLRFPKVRNNQALIVKIWSAVVDEHARDIYHLVIILSLFRATGRGLFEQFFQRKMALTSKNLHDIQAMLGKNYDGNIQDKIMRCMEVGKHDKRKVILYLRAKEDWNMYGNYLYEELKNIPPKKYQIYFSFITSVSHLASVIKKTSEYKPIDILIISGHGNRDSMVFGYSPSQKINIETLKLGVFNGIKQCFAPNAICYLGSCEAGKDEQAIANHISEILGIKVIAPHGKTSLHMYVGRFGKLKFKYHNSEESMFTPPQYRSP